MKKKLFYFNNAGIDSDVVNDAGKVTKYKQIAVIAATEEEARIQAKLDSDFAVFREYDLGVSWNV